VAKRKKRKKALKARRSRDEKRRQELGIDRKAWNDPSRFYTMGLLKYDEIPFALDSENRCPKCGQNKYRTERAQIVSPGVKKAFRQVNFCPCTRSGFYRFPFRNFGTRLSTKKAVPLTLRTLPGEMAYAEYEILPMSRDQNGACAKCHLLESKLAFTLVGRARIRKALLFCEHCNTLMKPHPDFDESLW